MTAWTAWVAFLDRREVGTSMALVRIGVGLTLLWTLLSVPMSGAYALLWYDVADGGYRTYDAGPWPMWLFGGYSARTVDAFFGVGIAGGLAVALGVGGPVLSRVLTFVTLQAFMGLADHNSHAGGGYDELLLNALWLLVLAGPSRTLSVECWRATGAWTSERTVAFWPRFLVVYQLVVMYGTTGWQKLSNHWLPGGDLSALYYIQQQPTWQLRDMRWLAQVYPLTQVGTAVTWWWEVLAPVWMLAFVASLPMGTGWVARGLRRARVREVWLVVGVTFHLLVQATMNIGPFTLISLALYPALVHPWEWRRPRG